MMTLLQAVEACEALCAEKWGPEWNKDVSLSVQVDYWRHSRLSGGKPVLRVQAR